jgi:hypothetical protein
LRLEGATNKQLQQITGATEGTVRNKLSELRSDGVITDDGKRPATYNLVSSSPRTRGDDDTSPPPVDGEANPAERALSDDLGPGESATVAELRSKRRERENPSVTDAATVVGGKVVHVHGPHRHGAVYVGNAWRPRGGSGSALEQAEFGNPYRVDKPGKPRDGDLPTVLENFYRWLMDKIEADAASMARLRAHAGKTLACWCVGKNGCPDVLLPDGPLWCHAQIILREANRLAAEEAEQKPRAKRLTTPEEAMRIQRLVSQGMKPELARREVLGVEA